MNNHKIIKTINVLEFNKNISLYYKENINLTKHAIFRLSEKQKELFNIKIIREVIIYEIPLLAGIQNNGNYAIFYKHGNNILKMILDIKPTNINIITFYIIEKNSMPII